MAPMCISANTTWRLSKIISRYKLQLLRNCASSGVCDFSLESFAEDSLIFLILRGHRGNFLFNVLCSIQMNLVTLKNLTKPFEGKIACNTFYFYTTILRETRISWYQSKRIFCKNSARMLQTFYRKRITLKFFESASVFKYTLPLLLL